MIMKNKIVIFFFSLIWRKRIVDRKVIEVRGWRTALLEDEYRGRWHTTFLFGKGKFSV